MVARNENDLEPGRAPALIAAEEYRVSPRAAPDRIGKLAVEVGPVELTPLNQAIQHDTQSNDTLAQAGRART
jgi:hypothetical protein